MTKLPTEEPQTVSRAVHAAPTQRELFLLLAVTFVVFWTSLFLLHKSTDLMVQSGDNAAYRDVANAILHWDFHDLQVQHFMGYPYLIAAVSLLFRVPTGVSLWVIALAGCVASVWLTARLFGTTAAGYFALTNFARLQVSYLGRSEPLAVALGLGSLLAFRWDRIVFTARRKWLGLTGIYSDGPLHGIVVGTLTDPAPWTNLVLSFFWIGLVLLGVGMMFSDNFRKYAKSYPNEAIFCGLYLFAIFSYDYLIWARSNFIGSASRRCRLLFCTVASSAQGPQGDLGPLRGECGGSGSFDSWGEKCVPRGCIEALVKSRTSVRAKSHLFKVAR